MVRNEMNRALADDRREGETMDLLGRELHTALFVEEYDHIYDSGRCQQIVLARGPEARSVLRASR